MNSSGSCRLARRAFLGKLTNSRSFAKCIPAPFPITDRCRVSCISSCADCATDLSPEMRADSLRELWQVAESTAPHRSSFVHLLDEKGSDNDCLAVVDQWTIRAESDLVSIVVLDAEMLLVTQQTRNVDLRQLCRVEQRQQICRLR